jgi:hypothetical protein
MLRCGNVYALQYGQDGAIGKPTNFRPKGTLYWVRSSPRLLKALSLSDFGFLTGLTSPQSLDFWSRREDLRAEEALILLHSGFSMWTKDLSIFF